MSAHFSSPKVSRAFTLMEMLLGLVILAAGIIGVYKLLGNAQSNAALEQEQHNAGALIDGVFNEYTAAADFSGLTTQIIVNSSITGIPRADGGLVSAFKTPILVRPATITTANDSFDLVYRNLNDKQCLATIKALYSRSTMIFVNETSDATTGAISTAGVAAQMTNGPSAGRLLPDGTLTDTAHCRHDNFKSGQGVVAFRFLGRTPDGANPPLGCGLCTPMTWTQSSACPVGQSGAVSTPFTTTCSAGCPSLATTVAGAATSTCTPDPGTCFIPAGTTRSWSVGGVSCTDTTTADTSVVSGSSWNAADSGAPSLGQAGFQCTNGTLSGAASPGATCAVSTTCMAGRETRAQACPAGDVGIIVETRTSTCATSSSTPSWSGWAVASNSCQTPSSVSAATCSPATTSRDIGCPAGQFGIIREEMTTECPTPTATPVTGTWVEQFRTCVALSCQQAGTCCTASSNTDNPGCPAGYTGTRTTRQDSTCASPSDSPVMGAWYDETNTCVASNPEPPHNCSDKDRGTLPAPAVNLTCIDCGKLNATTPGAAFILTGWTGGESTKNCACPGTYTVNAVWWTYAPNVERRYVTCVPKPPSPSTLGCSQTNCRINYNVAMGNPTPTAALTFQAGDTYVDDPGTTGGIYPYEVTFATPSQWTTTWKTCTAQDSTCESGGTWVAYAACSGASCVYNWTGAGAGGWRSFKATSTNSVTGEVIIRTRTFEWNNSGY